MIKKTDSLLKTDTTKTKILYELTFINNFQFMSTGLSQLVDNLKTDGIDKFMYINQEFRANTELMTKKDVLWMYIQFYG